MRLKCTLFLITLLLCMTAHTTTVEAFTPERCTTSGEVICTDFKVIYEENYIVTLHIKTINPNHTNLSVTAPECTVISSSTEKDVFMTELNCSDVELYYPGNVIWWPSPFPDYFFTPTGSAGPWSRPSFEVYNSTSLISSIKLNVLTPQNAPERQRNQKIAKAVDKGIPLILILWLLICIFIPNNKRKLSPIAYPLFSAILPGLGQILRGHKKTAIRILTYLLISFVLQIIVIGHLLLVLIWAWNIGDATYKESANKRKKRRDRFLFFGKN